MIENKKAAHGCPHSRGGKKETLTDTNIAQVPKLVKLSDVLALLKNLADGGSEGEWNHGYNAAITDVTQRLINLKIEVAPPAPEPDDLWSMLRKTCAVCSDGLVTGLECVCEAGNGHAYNIRLSIA